MNNENLRLIKPDPQDWAVLEQVASIDKMAFQEDGISVFNLSQFTRCGSLFCLIDETRQVIGEAVVLKNLPDNGAVVFALAVRPDLRGNGYGAKLLGMLVEQCREADLAYLELTMNPEDVAARKVYMEKHGFYKVAALSIHPEKNEPRWLVRLDLY